jgi:hypothetical protein
MAGGLARLSKRLKAIPNMSLSKAITASELKNFQCDQE